MGAVARSVHNVHRASKQISLCGIVDNTHDIATDSDLLGGDLGGLGDEVQADVRVVIAHDQEGLHLQPLLLVRGEGGDLLGDLLSSLGVDQVQVPVVVHGPPPVRGLAEGVEVSLLRQQSQLRHSRTILVSNV